MWLKHQDTQLENKAQVGQISQRAKISRVEAEGNGEVIVTSEDAIVLAIGEYSVGEDEILVVVDVDLVGLIH